MQEQPTKLFVYGIFLGAVHREHYNMTSPSYDTVLGYATFGSSIVKAVHCPTIKNLSLTGVTVEYDPELWWSLDRLEAGYDRIIVETTHGETCYMYAEHEDGVENHSTYVYEPYVYKA